MASLSEILRGGVRAPEPGEVDENIVIISICLGCGKRDLNKIGMKLKKCAECQGAEYCSQECQKRNWKYYKDICRSSTTDGGSDNGGKV